MYERLNTAGEPLKVIDLVRNAVFLTLGGDSEAADAIYADHWEPFESELGIEHQDKYFHPYALIPQLTIHKGICLSISEGVLGDRRGYRRVRGASAAEAIVTDLREYLRAFHALVGHSRPPGLTDESWKKITVLHRIDTPNSMYPYLLQLIQSHLQGETSASQLAQAIDIVDSFLTRRTVVGLSSTGVHTEFKDLWRRAAADDVKLMARLQARTIQFPDDDDFATAVREESIYSSSRCRYILTEYERGFTAGDPSEWDPSSVTVDHLMPQSAVDRGWGGVAKADAERLVNTWANLVPLSQKANSEKADRSWDETRKMMLEDSGTVFKSTNQVFNEFAEWNADTIGKRADSLAKWALERWPKPNFSTQRG